MKLTNIIDINPINQWIKNKSDGLWEHGYYFELSNLDNPGWHLKMSNDENMGFHFNITNNIDSEHSWIVINSDKHYFDGKCGLDALSEMLLFAEKWLNISTK